MFENLNQPYPFHNNFKHNLRTISFVCMGFMLIVLYFQPFGVNFLSSAREGFFVLIMGMVSAGTFFLSTLILPGFFPRLFESTRWTVKKELIWNACMFVVLIAGFALSAYIFKITSFQSLTLFRSGALAVLPLVLFNLLNYNTSLKAKVVQVIDSGRHWLGEDRKQLPVEDEDKVVLTSENGKEAYTAGVGNIILIQSASNYIEIFFMEGASVQRQLLRQTLSAVESGLSAFSFIRKCHRTTLVNLRYVNRISGTSPNVTLEVNGINFKVPVSRQRIVLFRKLIEEK